MERKTTQQVFGKPTVCYDVEFEPESPERFVNYRLADGTTLRVKFSANQILRIDGQWNEDGTPVYMVKNGLSVVLLESTIKRDAAIKKDTH
jgi:hypothetical protein